VKFHVKIPSGCQENGKKLQGILFLPHTVDAKIHHIRFSENLKVLIYNLMFMFVIRVIIIYYTYTDFFFVFLCDCINCIRN